MSNYTTGYVDAMKKIFGELPSQEEYARLLASAFHRAAEVQWERKVFTRKALRMSVPRGDYQAAECSLQFRRIMHSDTAWDDDPGASDVRTLGLLFAAEFTCTEGLAP